MGVVLGLNEKIVGPFHEHAAKSEVSLAPQRRDAIFMSLQIDHSKCLMSKLKLLLREEYDP